MLVAVLLENFLRHDSNNSGRVDTPEELSDMVTNLAFALDIEASHEELCSVMDAAGSMDKLQWEARAFFEWFILNVLAKYYCFDATNAEPGVVDWSKVLSQTWHCCCMKSS